MTTMTQEEIIKQVIERYVQEAERVFRREVLQAGLKLTGEMLDSIRAGAVTAAQGYVEGSVTVSGLLRIKDMKTLNFSRMPPFKAMERYVEAVGPENFAFVPGYKNGRRPSYTIQVERIAGGIMRKFKREPNVRRGYRGIYNDPLTKEIIPRMLLEIRESAGLVGVQQFKLLLQD